MALVCVPIWNDSVSLLSFQFVAISLSLLLLLLLFFFFFTLLEFFTSVLANGF